MRFARYAAAAVLGVPRSQVEAADVGNYPARPGMGGSWGWAARPLGGELAPFTIGAGPWPWGRDAAMTIPTISRARNLICNTIGALPLVSLRVGWDPVAARPTVTPIEPLPWFDRPDPTKTRAHVIAFTVDDLMFHGRAYWRVVARYTTGFPAGFQRMPYAEVRVDGDGALSWRPAGWADHVEVPDRDVVEFLSPLEGLLAFGGRSLCIALQLDSSAERYATTETPSGWIKQTGGESMGPAELDAVARHWHDQRMRNQTAALNDVTDYVESSMDPSRLQLTEARDFQSRELANLANVPPFLVGAPNGGGLTYTNAQESRALLLDYGAMPFVNAIEQTLSGPNVTPQGQAVRFDLEAWLRSPLTEGTAGPDDLTAPAAPAAPQEVPADA